ncbi:hypothetical protein AMECASPLE_009450 [Ameca splendens]|uniref:Uncharacterized protein n=1 Tax=Ameca splendens TaxID=208324 RepID=A0ABV0ZXM3_9TELE
MSKIKHELFAGLKELQISLCPPETLSALGVRNRDSMCHRITNKLSLKHAYRLSAEWSWLWPHTEVFLVLRYRVPKYENTRSTCKMLQIEQN